MKISKKILCPQCNKEAVWENNPYRPFCSDRCKLLDLGKWASEGYRIPDVKVVKGGEDEGGEED